MKIARLLINGAETLVAVRPDGYVNLVKAGLVSDDDLVALLDAGTDLTELAAAAKDLPTEPMDGVRYAVPIAWPRRVLCLGLNYSAHVGESGFKKQDVPTVFVRTPTSFVAHGEALEMPTASSHFDYEAELGVVIGRSFRDASESEALDCVAGYTCVNDGSVRDFQHATLQWTMGKNFDRSGGIGPWIVTPDDLPRGADGLAISCTLNGETVQSANTSEMIFKVGETLSYISKAMTLLPGDVIAMGTPQGVGHARTPPLWMKSGDEVTIEIEAIGKLTNSVAPRA